MRTLPHCQWRYVNPAADLKEGFMVVRSAALWAMTLGAISVAAPISGAHALTMKECSAKYKAAQDSGALKGMKQAAERLNVATAATRINRGDRRPCIDRPGA